MRIEQGEIIIRDALPSDSAQLAKWWNDGAVMAHAGFPKGLGITEDQIIRQLAQDRDDTKRRLIIEYQGQRIGETNYLNRGQQVAEIGIKLCDPAFQNRGLGRVILSLLIRRLFDEGYQKIVLDTNLHNVRAQHVYQLLGFKQTGVRSHAFRDQLGNWQTAVDFELMPTDFVEFALT